MKVNITRINVSLLNLLKNTEQVVFLDANFFIPPDRSHLKNIRSYKFDQYKDIWLDPLLTEFSGISIHESVYIELVEEKVKKYVDDNSNTNPSRLKVYYDIELDDNEKALMTTVVDKLAIHSQYDPDRDNSKDRGEVLSLSYMAVKGFIFFAANDDLPIRLINEAERLNTGLENMSIIQMYELIYYLYKTGRYDGRALRGLYKYQYYLTDREKQQNPEWGIFIHSMDKLYSEHIENE